MGKIIQLQQLLSIVPHSQEHLLSVSSSEGLRIRLASAGIANASVSHMNVLVLTWGSRLNASCTSLISTDYKDMKGHTKYRNWGRSG